MIYPRMNRKLAKGLFTLTESEFAVRWVSDKRSKKHSLSPSIFVFVQCEQPVSFTCIFSNSSGFFCRRGR